VDVSKMLRRDMVTPVMRDRTRGIGAMRRFARLW
jgi:hypothetical protein